MYLLIEMSSMKQIMKEKERLLANKIATQSLEPEDLFKSKTNLYSKFDEKG
jgi:hypothetical protein